jgi:acyl-CoA oxidase
MPQAKALKIIGCYAQTEIGHGSNVAGLETTATFDMKTDEWVIHTPTIRATKFWPGGMGFAANHAMVYARCITGEKDHGVQAFLVPIRDANHTSFPSVKNGDLGAKLGWNGVDNGWLTFT